MITQRPSPQAAGSSLQIRPAGVACAVFFMSGTHAGHGHTPAVYADVSDAFRVLPKTDRSVPDGCLCVWCVPEQACVCVCECVCLYFEARATPYRRSWEGGGQEAGSRFDCLTPGGEMIQLQEWNPISNQANQCWNIDRLMGAVMDLDERLHILSAAAVVCTAPTYHLIAISHNCYFVRPSRWG